MVLPATPSLKSVSLFVASASFAVLACSSGPLSVGNDRAIDSGLLADGGGGLAGGGAAGADNADAGMAGEAGARPLGPPGAGTLLGLLGACTPLTNGLLAPQSGYAKDVPVCALKGAVYWRSEMAVDCDGRSTTTCNDQTDPQFQNSTVGKDSAGNSLDAALVPYVEVPSVGSVFDYRAAGLSMGSVVAVIYKGNLAYGVVGHEQASDVIGAASVAMAAQIGINPDPVKGGLQSEAVTYVAFTGAANTVPALEDVAATAKLAEKAAAALIAASP